MKKMSLSIIIIISPFTVEKSLREAYNSVMNQDFVDYELIMSVESDNDELLLICEELCERDDRCILYHSNYEEWFIGRNAAVQKAKGKYLFFLNACNYISNGLCRAMIERASATDADTVYIKKLAVSKTGELISGRDGSFLESDLITEYDIALHCIDNYKKINFYSFLYKKELFEKIRFSEIDYDNIYLSRSILCAAKNIYTLNENVFYVRRIRYKFNSFYDDINAYIKAYTLINKRYNCGAILAESFADYQIDIYNAMMQADKLDNEIVYIIYKSDNMANKANYLKRILSLPYKKVFFVHTIDEDETEGNPNVANLKEFIYPEDIRRLYERNKYKILVVHEDLKYAFTSLLETGLIMNFEELMPFNGESKFDRVYIQAFKDSWCLDETH